MSKEPEIVVERDFDGYFGSWVRSMVQCKAARGESFLHTTIVVTAGPWRPYAVQWEKAGEGVLKLDFYSALRAGFGGISDEEVEELEALL